MGKKKRFYIYFPGELERNYYFSPWSLYHCSDAIENVERLIYCYLVLYGAVYHQGQHKSAQLTLQDLPAATASRKVAYALYSVVHCERKHKCLTCVNVFLWQMCNCLALHQPQDNTWFVAPAPFYTPVQCIASASICRQSANDVRATHWGAPFSGGLHYTSMPRKTSTVCDGSCAAEPRDFQLATEGNSLMPHACVFTLQHFSPWIVITVFFANHHDKLLV